jgi:cysteine-rich repeat protein
MTVDTTGSNAVLMGFDPVIYVRKTCTDTTTQLACNDAIPPTIDKLSVPVTAGETYYLFIDGYDASSGNYQLNVKIIPPACGNTLLEPPEECDDGNLVDGDGCSHLCILEPGNNDKCPGTVLALTQSGSDWKGTVTGDTALLASDYQGTCGSSGTAKDAVYQINSGPGGMLTAAITTASFDAVVYVRSDNCLSGSQAGCADATGNGGDTLTVNAPPNTAYWVFVDGYNGASGTFTLDVTVALPVCGNGKLEGSEQCDDNNLVAGDGCSPTCTLEPAGSNDLCPGQLLTLTQSGSQWGATVSGTTINLTANYTGSCAASTAASLDAVYQLNSGPGGKLHATLTTASFDAVLYAHTSPCGTGAELDCDDAVSLGGDTITFNAAPNTDYWLFVDGYNSESGSFTLNVSLTPAACGNGSVEGAEQCDDGNLVANDGSGPTCLFEGTCGTIAEVEPNPYSSPQAIPSACGTFQIPSASMPLTDADYYQVQLLAGTTLTASTFVGTLGACTTSADTVLSLWNAPMSQTNESAACSTAGYLECNDTDPTNGPCSTITHAITTSGTYVLKVHNWFTNKAIPAYGLAVTVK